MLDALRANPLSPAVRCYGLSFIAALTFCRRVASTETGIVKVGQPAMAA